MVLPVIAAVGAGKAAYDMYASEEERKANRRARSAFKEAEAARRGGIDAIELPEFAVPELSRYEDTFQYTPEQIQAIAIQRPDLLGYEGDPVVQQAQMDALAKLAEYSTGDLTEADRLNLQEAQIEASRGDRGRQAAILQAMARRGQAGGGAEMAARLQSAQSASEQASQQARASMVAAQQRALQAISQRGALAGDIRGQAFSEAERQSQAMDAIRRFNETNRMNAARTNVMSQNQAMLEAARNSQRVAAANVDIANRQAMMPGEMEQARFGAQMQKESVKGGISSDPYVWQQIGAANTYNQRRNIFGQVADVGGAYWESQKDAEEEERLKNMRTS
jgi:hypothetical protein